MRLRNLRLKAKAADTPRAGSGPGAETAEVGVMVRLELPVVKSRKTGKAVGSAASRRGVMSRRLNDVTVIDGVRAEKKYSVVPSPTRLLASRLSPTNRSIVLPDAGGKMKLRKLPTLSE